MGAAAVGVAQKEDDEQGIDQQDIFDRVVFFLAAITCRLCRRVLGADDPPLGAVMGKRGEAGAGARGTGSSSRGATTVAASASETPSRCIAEGAQRREEGGEQDMNPLIRFALAHAEQASLHDLERIGF